MKDKSIGYLSFFCFASVGILLGLSMANPPDVYNVFIHRPLNVILQSPDVRLVNFVGFTPSIIISLIGHYLLVTLFGYCLAWAFFAQIKNVYLPIKFFAAFFVGFTCLLGVIRVVSLLVGYNDIYFPVLSIIILVCLMTFVINRKDINVSACAKIFLSPKSWGRALAFVVFFVVILGTLLILQISQGDFSWVGHGPFQYARSLVTWRGAGYEHFPMFIQHYDELIFHYFLTIQLPSSYNPILPWWITLALTKISTILFVYTVFRRFSVGKVSSWVYCMFLMFGTSSLLPSKYYMLFDSSNPIFYTVHTGRIIGFGFALLFLVESYMFNKSYKNSSILFYIFAGLGIAATSLSNFLWLFVLLGIFVISMCRFRKVEEISDVA